MNSFQYRHLPPEREEGDYFFDGQILLTAGVNQVVPLEEIDTMVTYIRELVKQNQGIDYFQVFQDKESGQKIYFIDQLTRAALESDRYEKKDNHATLLFAHEY